MTLLLCFQAGDISELQVKFGQECLILDTWVRRKQYDALCYILGPGINIHLSENELLRDIFQLGAKILISDLSLHRQTKLERVSFYLKKKKLKHYINMLNFCRI